MKKFPYAPARAIAFVLFCLVQLGCSHIVHKVSESQALTPKTSPPSLDQKVNPPSVASIDPATVVKGDSEKIPYYYSDVLKARKYAELEASLTKALKDRERVTGGSWKLARIHAGLLEPNVGKNAAESEWKAHLSRLEEWKKNMPESIAARIALAGAWVTYGFEARGEGFANTISDENLRLFHSRSERALNELNEEKQLAQRSPEWYSIMLKIGLAQGWNRSKYDEVFEEGFRLEPTYFSLQQQKIHYLLPQWHGNEGEIGKFISENSGRIPGPEGDMMYFLLLGTVQSSYRSEVFPKTGLSFEKARIGYENLKAAYGTNRYRKNMYLYLALYNHVDQDTDQLEAAFNEVGDDYDPDVWLSREAFDSIRGTIDMTRKIKARMEQIKNLPQRTPPPLHHPDLPPFTP